MKPDVRVRQLCVQARAQLVEGILITITRTPTSFVYFYVDGEPVEQERVATAAAHEVLRYLEIEARLGRPKPEGEREGVLVYQQPTQTWKVMVVQEDELIKILLRYLPSDFAEAMAMRDRPKPLRSSGAVCPKIDEAC